jgi:hypothetical protein
MYSLPLNSQYPMMYGPGPAMMAAQGYNPYGLSLQQRDSMDQKQEQQYERLIYF